MKRFVSLLLVFILVLSVFSGCGNTPAPAETTEATQATEAPEEANVLKIMILGSSRSVNAFHFLYQAFKDQMPEQELVLGIMYYSGCSMSMHTEFIQTNQSVYRYYLNTDGVWSYQSDVHMDVGLTDQNWDVILLQAGTGDLENEMNKPCREFITEYVDSRISHPHTFWWHSTWFNSTNPALFDPSKTKLDPTKINQSKQLQDGIDAAKAYVLKDPMFAGRITSGTPMMYALKKLQIPEVELYRDHTHLSDYGCLLVGYSFYTQFTGKPVTQINLDVLAKAKRQPQYQSKGDLTITQEMKDIMIRTADYTHKNPWTVPVKEAN